MPNSVDVLKTPPRLSRTGDYDLQRTPPSQINGKRGLVAINSPQVILVSPEKYIFSPRKIMEDHGRETYEKFHVIERDFLGKGVVSNLGIPFKGEHVSPGDSDSEDLSDDDGWEATKNFTSGFLGDGAVSSLGIPFKGEHVSLSGSDREDLSDDDGCEATKSTTQSENGYSLADVLLSPERSERPTFVPSVIPEQMPDIPSIIHLSPETRRPPEEWTPITKLINHMKEAKVDSVAYKKASDSVYAKLGKKRATPEETKANATKIIRGMLRTVDPSTKGVLDYSCPEIHKAMTKRFYEDRIFKKMSLWVKQLSKKTNEHSNLQKCFTKTLVIDLNHILNLKDGKGGHICPYDLIFSGKVKVLQENPYTKVFVGEEDGVVKTKFPVWIRTAEQVISFIHGAQLFTKPVTGRMLCRWDSNPFVEPIFFEIFAENGWIVKTAYPLFSVEFVDMKSDQTMGLWDYTPVELKDIADKLLNEYFSNKQKKKSPGTERLANPIKHTVEDEEGNEYVLVEFAPYLKDIGKTETNQGIYYGFPAEVFEQIL